MSIMAKETVGKQVTPGTHLAVCYRVVDIGTQPDTGYGEKEKVVIFWELPHERILIDGHEKPMGISKFYSKSLGKKANLRKDLEAWRGRAFSTEELAGFDLANILGKPCQLQVVDNGEGKSQVSAVVGVPKGTQVPPAMNPLAEYSVAQGKDADYAKLPDWVKDMADKCLEWQEKAVPEAIAQPVAGGEPPPPDDVPF